MANGTLAPTLLLAMPQMQDPNFARTVVLLCKQEEEGAMGLVINRATETLASSVLDFDPPLRDDSKLPIYVGGPVEPQRGWLLLGFDPGTSDVLKVGEGLFLSSSMDVLRDLVEAGDRPDRHGRFFVGYAGWSGGQLENELASSAWLTVDVSLDLIFETAVDEMWEAAIRTLGVDPFVLQTGGGMH
ncbi:MAG TPA: YqgE/AlgH family protein [Terriglobales bacterium]|nr:YqgE/AlgH family protein [Terriglobales bacterium]